jgi:hypothetical protein
LAGCTGPGASPSWRIMTNSLRLCEPATIPILISKPHQQAPMRRRVTAGQTHRSCVGWESKSRSDLGKQGANPGMAATMARRSGEERARSRRWRSSPSGLALGWFGGGCRVPRVTLGGRAACVGRAGLRRAGGRAGGRARRGLQVCGVRVGGRREAGAVYSNFLIISRDYCFYMPISIIAECPCVATGIYNTSILR